MGDKTGIFFWTLICLCFGTIAGGGYSAGNNVDNESSDVPSSYQPFNNYYISRVFRQAETRYSGSNDLRGSGNQRGGNPSNWNSGFGTSSNSGNGNAWAFGSSGKDTEGPGSSWSSPNKNSGNQRGNKPNGNSNGFGSNSQKQSYSSNSGFREEPRTEGYIAPSSNKKQGNKWTTDNTGGNKKGSNNNSNWDFEPETEGYSGLGYSNNKKTSNGNGWNSEPITEGYSPLTDNKKTSGNQWNGNSNSWNSGSQSANNQGSNTNSWNSGSQPPKKQGNGNTNSWSSNQNSNSWNSGSQPSKNQGNSNSNSWNSNSQPAKNQGSSNTNSWNQESNSWGSNSQPSKNQGGSNTNSWNQDSISGQQQPKKPGNDKTNSLSSNQNSNSWNSGSQPAKNQGNSNSNSWNSNSQPAKNQGNSNTNSWSSNSQPSKNQGGSNTNSWNQNPISGSQSPKKPGNDKTNSWSSNQNSNSWNSGSQQANNQGNGKPNFWTSNQGPKKESESEESNESGFSSNKKPSGNQWGGNTGYRPSKKPTNSASSGTSNQGSNNGNDKTKKPQNSNQGGNSKGNEKPSQKQEVDWDNIEKQNKEGDLKLDLSLLWGQNNRKNQNGNSRFKSKKRDITGNSEKYMPQCVCTDSENCDQENNINIMNVFKRGRYHLSSKVFQCAMDDKICCMQSPSTPENVLGEDGNDLAEYGKKVGLSRSSCGRRLSKLTDEEINGDGIANYGDFPWMLKMVSQDEYGETMICSASLIHNSIALTTASCAMLLSGDKVRVVAGDWNLFSGHGRNSIRETKIGNIFLHPEFDLVNNKHDVALVFLDQELDSGLGINSVCLPSASDAWDVNRCAIVGWTKEDRQDMRPTSLRIIDLETINQGKCRNSSGNLRNDISESASQDFICAHSQDGIPCIADVGASLQCPLYNSDTYVQVGLVFPTSTCNRFAQSATFTDVLDSMDWISHMEGVYFLARNGLI